LSSSTELGIQNICGYRSDSNARDLGDTIVLSTRTGDSGSDRTAVFETTDIDSENVSTSKVPAFTEPFAEQKNDGDEERKTVC